MTKTYNLYPINAAWKTRRNISHQTVPEFKHAKKETVQHRTETSDSRYMYKCSNEHQSIKLHHQKTFQCKTIKNVAQTCNTVRQYYKC